MPDRPKGVTMASPDTGEAEGEQSGEQNPGGGIPGEDENAVGG